LAIAEGKAKGQDVSSLENMLRTLGSSDYRQSQLSRVYAKKGTKLRSTTEQMLLDNNKIVAKAISKLSDNTMKLILKAMS
jgi:vacuolar-type H+-ATPase subunit C/Vma6